MTNEALLVILSNLFRAFAEAFSADSLILIRSFARTVSAASRSSTYGISSIFISKLGFALSQSSTSFWLVVFRFLFHFCFCFLLCRVLSSSFSPSSSSSSSSSSSDPAEFCSHESCSDKDSSIADLEGVLEQLSRFGEVTVHLEEKLAQSTLAAQLEPTTDSSSSWILGDTDRLCNRTKQRTTITRCSYSFAKSMLYEKT